MTLHLSADTWRTNADLIAEVAEFWDFDSTVRLAIDLTYNQGKWWRVWQPTFLAKNDLDARFGDYHFDYRGRLPWADGSFDLVAFDPPYVSSGGRRTSTIHGMNDSYGITTSALSPGLNQEWIDLGLKQAVRVCKIGGWILCKVQDYRSSGKMFLGTHHTLTSALKLDVEVEAVYHHVGRPRAQPKKNPDGSPREQKSPRNNVSTLYLFRKTNPSNPEPQGGTQP